MCNHKIRAGMALRGAFKGFEDGDKRRKGRARKVPIGMRMELFVALVVRINGIKKSHRIGDMHQHGNIQLPGHGPEWVETTIINGHKHPVLVAYVQPERLPDFEAGRTTSDLRLQALRRPGAEIVPVLWPRRPIDPCKHTKAIGSFLHEMCQMPIKDVSPPSTI